MEYVRCSRTYTLDFTDHRSEHGRPRAEHVYMLPVVFKRNQMALLSLTSRKFLPLIPTVRLPGHGRLDWSEVRPAEGAHAEDLLGGQVRAEFCFPKKVGRDTIRGCVRGRKWGELNLKPGGSRAYLQQYVRYEKISLFAAAEQTKHVEWHPFNGMTKHTSCDNNNVDPRLFVTAVVPLRYVLWCRHGFVHHGGIPGPTKNRCALAGCSWQYHICDIGRSNTMHIISYIIPLRAIERAVDWKRAGCGNMKIIWRPTAVV